MNNKFPVLFIFLSSLQYITCLAPDCLSDVRVADISSEQANITWTYSCDSRHLQAFKIFYHHIEYKACSSEMNKEKMKKVKEKRWRDREEILPTERFKVIGAPEQGRGLQPYSVYIFRVIAVRGNSENNNGGEMTVTGDTEPSLPLVELRPGLVVERTEDLVRFELEPKWRDLQCDKLNTEPGAVLYQALDQEDGVIKGEVGVDSKEITLTELQPDSEYRVKLFVADQEGKFDAMEAVEFTRVRTSAGPPSVEDGEMTLLISVILAVVILTVLVTATVLIVRKCNLIKKFKGWERASANEDEPIIRYKPKIEIKSRRPDSSTGNGSPSAQPASNRSSVGRRSVYDPLPEEPGAPLYEELNFKPSIVEDEEGYVIPTATKVPKMASVESLDDEGYLKPNFNRYPPTDTRNSTGTPPPIPPVSYSSQDELEKSPITTDF